jgi:hypothetical protein
MPALIWHPDALGDVARLYWSAVTGAALLRVRIFFDLVVMLVSLRLRILA